MDKLILILEIISKLLPFIKKFVRWLKERRINGLTLKEIQERTHVLFIDDEKFDKVDRIKDHGWITDRIADVRNSIDNDKISRSHVIFVDYKGVGKKISPTEEGLGIIKSIKKMYPQKRVILYSAHCEFDLSDELSHRIADDILPKNSDVYVYLAKIEENARLALSAV